jgi:cytochrome c-type biogenesis protein CcmH/NrfG
MNGMMGQTTVMVNGLNLGNLNPPGAKAAVADKLVADLQAAAAKLPTAENYYLLGEALRKSGQKDQAAAAYRKAIELRPGYLEATKALTIMKE